MSTAELTARNFYDTYHLESMPEDVKMHLIVLLSKTSKKEGHNEESNEHSSKPYSFEELKERIEVGEQEEEQGLLTAHEDVMSNLRKRIAL